MIQLYKFYNVLSFLCDHESCTLYIDLHFNFRRDILFEMVIKNFKPFIVVLFHLYFKLYINS